MENENIKPQESEGSLVGYDLTQLLLSGVFKVECVPEKRAYFGEGKIMYLETERLISDLEHGTCKNQQVAEDYKKYGPTNFFISVVGVYYDEEKRKAALVAAKAAWEGELY